MHKLRINGVKYTGVMEYAYFKDNENIQKLHILTLWEIRR